MLCFLGKKGECFYDFSFLLSSLSTSSIEIRCLQRRRNFSFSRAISTMYIRRGRGKTSNGKNNSEHFTKLPSIKLKKFPVLTGCISSSSKKTNKNKKETDTQTSRLPIHKGEKKNVLCHPPLDRGSDFLGRKGGGKKNSQGEERPTPPFP